jgi:cytosine/creatinine deaminase
MSQGKMDSLFAQAIEEARSGLGEGGIPIGSVLIRGKMVIGKGHNMHVQNKDPTAHAEIECLRNTGRIGSYDQTVLCSTLMPCYMCAGAVVHFGIKKVIVGESRNFEGAKEFMLSHGIEVVDLDSVECVELMREFILRKPALWDEDIGKK